MTLGDWIPLLTRYGFDLYLIEEVKFFISLRNDCAHDLLDLDMNVQSLNKKILANNDRFTNLMILLFDTENSILQKMNWLLETRIDLLKRNGSPKA
jgi:hypothetical protein